MSTQTDPRSIATDLIRSAASDIDTMGIGEFLEGRDIDDPDGGITEQVDELIRKATVLVGWPATEPSGPADGLDLDAIRQRAEFSADPFHAEDVNDLIAALAEEQAQHQATLRNQSALSAEVLQLRAALELTRDQRDAARAMADELRDDLRAADESNANLQQHIADVRSGAF